MDEMSEKERECVCVRERERERERETERERERERERECMCVGVYVFARVCEHNQQVLIQGINFMSRLLFLHVPRYILSSL